MSFDLRFVDSIASAPTVRLDLMAAPWGVQRGTEFGMPELKRASVGTLLRDGEHYPAAAFSNRLIRLVARVVDVDDDSVAGVLQTLYRELDRPTNIIQYRPGTTEPIFFRTFRAAPESVQWDPELKEARVTIPARPFAVGLRETLPPVVVSNNPAAPSNGCYFEVSGIRGDFETPLCLSLGTDFMGAAPATRGLVMGVRRRGTPSAAPWLLQAEAMTTGTSTALAGATDAAMSGSGPNYMRVTPGGALLEQRVYVDPFPAGASGDVRGRYRVLMRTRQSSVLDQWVVQLRYGPNTTLPVTNDAVSLSQTTSPRYIDLGTIQFPYGADPVTDGMSGVEVPARGTRIAVWAQRAAGSGTLDIDCLLFVPADDSYSVSRIYTDTGAAAGIIDATRTMIYAVGGSGEIRPPLAPNETTSAFPMVSPGVTNRIVFLADGGSLADSALTATSTVTPYYWPQYAYVRAVGS